MNEQKTSSSPPISARRSRPSSPSSRARAGARSPRRSSAPGEFGDISENFEYHAAKNEQGLLERRIQVLRDRLHHAVTVEHQTDEHVGVGSFVEVEDDGGEKMEVEISAVGGVSPDSPLGRALLGAGVGDEVVVEAPSGSWKARVRGIGAPDVGHERERNPGLRDVLLA